MTDRKCPQCGESSPLEQDFCSNCGEYLRWEPTEATPVIAREPAPGEASAAPAQPPATPPPPPTAPAPPEAEKQAVAGLTLRDPASVDGAAAAVELLVPAGSEGTLLAEARNQGEIVDNFDLRIEGLPDGWWTIAPPTVFLVPFGTRGDFQQEVTVRLHPPRSAEAEARPWPFEL